MQALTPIRMTLSSKPDTYSGAIAPSGAWKQHLQYDLEICEVHTDLKDSDLLTITSLTSITCSNPELIEC